MVQSLYKIWILVSKIGSGSWTNSDKQLKVQKVEIRWATFVQKMHSFNWNIILCETSPNSLCHFWSHFSRDTLVDTFLAQKLHTLDQKCLHLLLITLKLTSNSSRHFSNKNSVFLQSLNHSSLSWDITLLCFFGWNFKYYWLK